MQYSRDSIVQFAADSSGWTADFKNEDQQWDLPILGWAVVVGWTDYDGKGSSDDGSDAETNLEPVVLGEDGYPYTITAYRRDHPGAKLVQVNRRD